MADSDDDGMDFVALRQKIGLITSGAAASTAAAQSPPRQQ